MAAQNGIITAADAKHLGATTFDQYGHFKTWVNPYIYPDMVYWGARYQSCLYSASCVNIFNKTNYNDLSLSSPNMDTGFALPANSNYLPERWNNTLFQFTGGYTFLYNKRNRNYSGVITLNINDTGDYPICVGAQMWGPGYNQHATSYPINGLSFVTGAYLLLCYKNAGWSYPYANFYEILQGPPLFYQRCIELGTITYNNA